MNKYKHGIIKTSVICVTIIIGMFILPSVFISEKEAKYELEIESNAEIINKYNDLRQEVLKLSELVKKQKITKNVNYNTIVADSNIYNFGDSDTLSYWFVYINTPDFVGSYGIKLEGSVFNEKKIIKKIYRKRFTKKGIVKRKNIPSRQITDIGGITFYRRISYKEYTMCETLRD